MFELKDNFDYYMNKIRDMKIEVSYDDYKIKYLEEGFNCKILN